MSVENIIDMYIKICLVDSSSSSMQTISVEDMEELELSLAVHLIWNLWLPSVIVA